MNLSDKRRFNANMSSMPALSMKLDKIVDKNGFFKDVNEYLQNVNASSRKLKGMIFDEDKKKLSWNKLAEFLNERKETSSSKQKDSNKSFDHIQEINESVSSIVESRSNPNELNEEVKVTKENVSEKIITNKKNIDSKFESMKHDLGNENEIIKK